MENTPLNALQTEVEFYRENQAIVEQEIRTLIADNQKLSHQVGMLLKEKLENARNAHDTDHDKDVEEFRKQVILLTKERDSLHVLWQTSQKTIDALETELKVYQGYENSGKQNINEERRDLQLKLETALTDYIELEAKYKERQRKHSILESDVKNKEKDIISYQEKGKQLDEKLVELTKDLEECKINLAVEKKNSEDMKEKLALCQKECTERVKKEAEAKSKVAEALQLYDVVAAQKNEAYKKIREITGELSQLKQKLMNVKRDTEAEYRNELDELKDKYNEKVCDMLEHIRNIDTELVEKGLLLNKVMRENKILQDTNDSYFKQQQDSQKSVHPKLLIAEQRLEAMFQELVLSERRNIQMVCEKQCLAIDIQRMQDAHNREIKRRDWEEKLLKSQCDELKLQVEHLQISLQETHAMVNKLQKMLLSRKELSEKIVSTKEEELLELNKHLENQMELNKKWRESYVEMTEKLKKRLEQLQNENKGLRSKLKLPHSSSYEEDTTPLS